jgi:hypothetical protein
LSVVGDPAAIEASQAQEAAEISEAFTFTLQDLGYILGAGSTSFSGDLESEVDKDLLEEEALDDRQGKSRLLDAVKSDVETGQVLVEGAPAIDQYVVNIADEDLVLQAGQDGINKITEVAAGIAPSIRNSLPPVKTEVGDEGEIITITFLDGHGEIASAYVQRAEELGVG